MSRFPWYCAVPLVVLIALTRTNLYLIDYFRVHEITVTSLPVVRMASENLAQVGADWSARSLMQVGTVAFFLLATLVTGVSWYVILRALSQFRHRGWFILGTLVLGVVLFSYMWTNVFDATPLTQSLVDIVETRTKISLKPLYNYMFCTWVALLVWVSGAYTAVLLPNYQDPDPNVTTESDEKFLHDRMIWTRMVLYSTSLLFCVSLLYSYGAVAWSATYIPDEVDRKAILSIAHYSTVRVGLFYTMVLTAVYLPAEMLLRVRASKLARDAGALDIEQRTTWLKTRGLRLSLWKEAPHTLAVLSPLLAGVASFL